MDLFTYLMAKKGHNTHRDLFSYLLGKNAGGSGTYTTFAGTSLNISNTLQAKIKNIALEGNTSQDGIPTPDTPIPIKVVTGEQSINIHNKNLFDKDNQVKVQVNAGGTLRYGIIVNAPNKKVSISAKNWNNSIAVKQLINGTYGDFLNINSNTTFDVTDKLIIYSTSDTAKLDTNIEDLQIEISNVPTEYVPYQSQTYPLSLGNIELAKIGNYKDYIFKNVTGSPYYNADLDLNGWYLYKEINKIMFDGTETGWTYYTGGGAYKRFELSINDIIQYTSRGNVLANYFKYLGTDIINEPGNIFSLNKKICLYPETSISSVNEWKNWLSTHKTEAYYPLENSTNTKITDTTLISQLENINNNARSYKDTTIIECTSASADNETIGFSGEIKVTSVGLGNSLNASLLSQNINDIQNEEEPNIDDIQEEQNLDEIEEQNDEPTEKEVS